VEGVEAQVGGQLIWQAVGGKMYSYIYIFSLPKNNVIFEKIQGKPLFISSCQMA